MIQLLITTQGVVRALYTELIPISVLGPMQIKRASHVEPDPSGNWWADLEPSQGPILGPFTRRSEALQAESDWLNQHVLFGSQAIQKKVENSTDEEHPSFEVTPISDTVAERTIQTAPVCIDLF